MSRIWSRRSPTEAETLYTRVVAQARQPAFYRDHGVPDTLDGRYDMIALHMFLVLHRLKQEGAAGGELAQALHDVMFDDMDRSLREMGVGDLGVGRRVRAMAEGLYGRIAAYEAGLNGDDGALAAALRRNLFGSVATEPNAAALKALGAYMRSAMTSLTEQKLERLAAGEIAFPPAPGPA